jgi:hypothetical protein
MGLLDKVKDAAQNATVAAKDAAAKGQAKLDGAQAKRQADGLLRDLGAAYYATKMGRATTTTDADVDRLITALQAHEAEHGQITLAPETAAANPTAVPADGSTPPPPPPAAASPSSPPPPPPPPAAVADPASPPPPPPTAQTL